MSISTDGSVSVRPARALRPLPAARRIDTALRDNELQFRELLEALPAAIYTIDAEGRITFFNEAAADLWGCRPERVVRLLAAVLARRQTDAAR